jgi:hypothetical protein
MLHVTVHCNSVKCSGVGGSSILAGCILQAIASAMGKPQSNDNLLMLVLQVSTCRMSLVNATATALH